MTSDTLLLMRRTSCYKEDITDAASPRNDRTTTQEHDSDLSLGLQAFVKAARFELFS